MYRLVVCVKKCSVMYFRAAAVTLYKRFGCKYPSYNKGTKHACFIHLRASKTPKDSSGNVISHY